MLQSFKTSQKIEFISIQDRGGLISGCIFCLKVDGPITEGGFISGGTYHISGAGGGGGCDWMYFFVSR